MELFLYKCERCGVALFAEANHGPVWYVDCCGSCKEWSYHNKIIIKPAYDMLLNLQGFGFIKEVNLEKG